MKLKNQGLYLSEFEHDNCGAGFICSLNGERTNNIIGKALNILSCLEHRGAVSSDGRTGDGAGILIEIPHRFFAKKCDFVHFLKIFQILLKKSINVYSKTYWTNLAYREYLYERKYLSAIAFYNFIKSIW